MQIGHCTEYLRLERLGEPYIPILGIQNDKERQQEGNGTTKIVCTCPGLLARPGSRAGRRLLFYFKCDRSPTRTLCWPKWDRRIRDFPVPSGNGNGMVRGDLA